MNRVFTIAFLLLGLGAFAQVEEEETTTTEETVFEETEEKDTTRFKVGDVEFIIVDHDTLPAGQKKSKSDNWEMYVDKNDLTYWTGFDIGINMLMDWNKTFNSLQSPHLQFDPANSFSFSFNFLEQRIRIIKDHFGIVTGLGFTNSRYGFKDPYMRLGATNDATFGVIDSSLVSGFSKNQLRVNYFNVPLLFNINFSKNPRKNFHIAFGAIGSVRMNSNMKYKYEVLGGETKNKEKGRYNLNAFNAQATARVGFRNFGIFANYSFLPLFEKDKSEVAYPVTFGASWHF